MKTNVFGKGAAVGVRLTAGLGLGLFVGIVATCSIILTQRAVALSNVGPDAADFATNVAWYTVSNTKDVQNSFKMGLTVFHTGAKPTTNISLTMIAQGCPCQGANLSAQGTGRATFTVQGGATYGPFQGGSGSKVLTLKPTDGWVAQGNGYTLHLDITLVNTAQSADNTNHFNFKMSLPAGSGNIIGPDGNYRFAVLQGPSVYCTNSTGSCAPTYTYRIPFAPDCTVTTPQVKQVKLHDVDQGNPYIQPQHMAIQVRDTTTGATVARNQYAPGGMLNETGGEGNGQDALFTFTAQPGHKYQLLLTSVNGNNVLQMFLPYDSINAQIDCRPVGAIVPGATNGCTALQGWIYDNNNAALKIQYYVLSNPASAAASYPGTQPAADPNFAGPFLANLANPAGTPGTVPAGHGFKVNIPADVTGHNYRGPWRANAYNIYAKDPYNGNLYKVASLSQPACAPVNCGTSTFAPTMASDPITFTVSMASSAYGSLPLPDPDFTVTVTGPSGSVSYPSVAATWTSPNITSAVMTFTPPTPGSYTATWVYNGITCSDVGNLAGYEPYFNVIGGDISAGNGFDNGGVCNGDDAAGIRGWNQNTSAINTFGGSGSGLAAFATANNGISDFVSGIAATPGLVAAQGHRLSFADYDGTGYVTPPVYGDSFGPAADLPCVHDYQADAPAASRVALGVPGTITNADLAAAVTAGGNYKGQSANVTIGDGTTVTLSGGKQMTLYINGDVYITSNILYSYAQPSGIPQFRLVVQGSIYIAPNVTELHGVYIAQKSGGPTTGIFSTCASGLGTPISDYAICNQQLRVVGAVAAEGQVLMGRTHSSVLPDPPTISVAEPAEIFQYSPELWLNQSNGAAPAGPLTYQAFTGLPPVL